MERMGASRGLEKYRQGELRASLGNEKERRIVRAFLCHMIVALHAQR